MCTCPRFSECNSLELCNFSTDNTRQDLTLNWASDKSKESIQFIFYHKSNRCSFCSFFIEFLFLLAIRANMYVHIVYIQTDIYLYALTFGHVFRFSCSCFVVNNTTIQLYSMYCTVYYSIMKAFIHFYHFTFGAVAVVQFSSFFSGFVFIHLSSNKRIRISFTIAYFH